MGFCKKKKPDPPPLQQPPPRSIVPQARVDPPPTNTPLPRRPIPTPAVPKLAFDLIMLQGKLELARQSHKAKEYKAANDLYTEIVSELLNHRNDLKSSKSQKLLAQALHELALVRSDIHGAGPVSSKDNSATRDVIKLEKRFLALQREWHGKNSLKLCSTLYDIGMLHELLDEKDKAKGSFEDILKIMGEQKAHLTPDDITMQKHVERMLRRYNKPPPPEPAPVVVETPPQRSVPVLDFDHLNSRAPSPEPSPRVEKDHYSDDELAREEWGIRRRESLDRPMREWGIDVDTPATALANPEQANEWGTEISNTIDIQFGTPGDDGFYSDDTDPDAALSRSYRVRSPVVDSVYETQALQSARALRAKGPYFASRTAKGLENEWGVPSPRGKVTRFDPNTTEHRLEDGYHSTASPSRSDYYVSHSPRNNYASSPRRDRDDDLAHQRRQLSTVHLQDAPITPRDSHHTNYYSPGKTTPRGRPPRAPQTPRGWDTSVTSLQTGSNLIPSEWGEKTPSRSRRRDHDRRDDYDDDRYRDDYGSDSRSQYDRDRDAWFDNDYSRRGDRRGDDKDDRNGYSYNNFSRYDDRKDYDSYDRNNDSGGYYDNDRDQDRHQRRHRDFDLDHDPRDKKYNDAKKDRYANTPPRHVKYETVTEDGWRSTY